MENNEQGFEYQWEDEIEKDHEYILLPEGEYEFKVSGFERGRYTGGEKLPPCNIAKLKLEIVTDAGSTTINHNLFLHSRLEGMLSTFFNCIGQKKRGEKLKMDWNKVVGATGRAKIKTREYNGNTFNEVKSFILTDKATTQPASTFKEGVF